MAKEGHPGRTKQVKRLLYFCLGLLVFAACGKEDKIEVIEEAQDPYGIDYLFHSEEIPQIHITIPLEQWNKLLSYYDANHDTKQYIRCDALIVRDGKGTTISGAGLRLRGNTSRRRPEKGSGEHQKDKADWQHCHFSLNFDYYTRDEAHEVEGSRGVWLKWFKDDPMYVREVYCYDLFRRAGVWTAINSAYCRLWIHVEGDREEAYFGVYEMLEPINGRFVKARGEQFGSAKGNLWKCRYGARLNSVSSDFGRDDGSEEEHIYEFKTDSNDFEGARTQLCNFIRDFNSMEGGKFRQWVSQVIDVPLLMKTYAVNVAVGMWDDYWFNCNNYYIYFNSTDEVNYKLFFIPYDYDNTLGTSQSMDSGRQDPFAWGSQDNPLIYKLLQIDDYRELYRQALLELLEEDKALLCYEASTARIRGWQERIAPYIDNDTGEDCKIEDKPAGWGNHGEYRLLTGGRNDNYFKVKAESIQKYCQ